MDDAAEEEENKALTSFGSVWMSQTPAGKREKIVLSFSLIHWNNFAFSC